METKNNNQAVQCLLYTISSQIFMESAKTSPCKIHALLPK